MLLEHAHTFLSPFPGVYLYSLLLNSKGPGNTCNQRSSRQQQLTPRLTPQTCLQGPFFSDFPVSQQQP